MTVSDPLDFFEKIADEQPSEPETDDKLIDPGEGAVLGLALASSLAVKAIPWLASMPVGGLAYKGMSSWPVQSPGPQKTVKDTILALNRAKPGLTQPLKKKFMGLFPVSERDYTMSAPVSKRDFLANKAKKAELDRVIYKMDRMQSRVDQMLYKYDLPKKGVKVSFKGGVISKWIGPHYAPLTKQVLLPTFNETWALHEIGHAVDYTAGPIGKARAIAGPLLRRAAMATLPIALIAGDEIKRALPGTVDDRVIEFMQQNAPAILGATLAATSLYPEAKASIIALKHIKKTQGAKHAQLAARRLLPGWGTYLLGAIAPMIGMSLAKKYYNEAHRKREEANVLTKESAGKSGISQVIKDFGLASKDILHLGRQIARGTAALMRDPQRVARIGRAAKEVGTDPYFIEGALMAGIPAAAATAWVYGSRHGPQIRELRERELTAKGMKSQLRTGGRLHEKAKEQIPEEWRLKNPGLYAGLVGAGAAFSGGIITKLFADLVHAL